MAFNDIKAWREIMDAEEQEKAAYDRACEDAEARAASAEQQEYDNLEQVQIDPDTVGCDCGNNGCVCLDDLEDDEVDFSAYGIKEADLGVGPADEHYATAHDLAREPLVRIPAAIGRPASDADLAAQDVVQLMMEAMKKLQEKKVAEQVDEEQEFEESDDELTEEEDASEKVDDKIEQMSQNDDYPLSDADWDEITAEPSYQKKIEMIQAKIKDRWSSLSAEAKRQVRDDVNELRKEFIKSRWSEKQFKEALRLQQISKKRELTDEEKKKFSDIVRFSLDDTQRAQLEKNLYANGFRIPREGRTTRVPASDAQSGNVTDHHRGEGSDERSNETGLDSEFDVSKYAYIPEPMTPGTEIPADFDPNYGPDETTPNLRMQRDIDQLAKALKPGHEERKKAWARKDLADQLGDDFYTNNPKVWKKIVGTLEPDEIQEITTDLVNELPGSKADNQRMLDYMFGGMKLTQIAIGAQAGYGADQKGRTGGLTQQGDKLMNLLLFALATHLNVATDHLERFWKNLKSENTGPRNVRKELRPVIFREICEELGVDLNRVGQELGVVPMYSAGVKAKRAADNLLITLFIREYDQMSAAERDALRQTFQSYENGAKIVKLYTGLNDDQNSEFQDLIIRMRDEGDLPNEDRVRLLQLDLMRRNPGIGEDIAHAQAERKYAQMTQNGEGPFVEFTTRLAKTFVRGHSPHHTRDTITNPDRMN